MSAPPAIRGCTICGNLSFSQEWYKAFGVVFCNGCKAQEELIPKVLDVMMLEHTGLVAERSMINLSSIMNGAEHCKAAIPAD